MFCVVYKVVYKLCSCTCVAVTAYGRAFYVSAVWAAMMWKSSFQLFYYTRHYRRLFEQRTGMCADVSYQKVWRQRRALSSSTASCSHGAHRHNCHLRLRIFPRIRMMTTWCQTQA